MAWVLDLDGVVWLGDQPIPGAAEAVAALQRTGEPVAFVTNNSFSPRSTVVDRLAAHGIDARGSVFTSAMAAASMIEPGSRALVCAGPGVVTELESRGVHTMDVSAEGAAEWGAEVVVVGFHRSFDYRRMTVASTAVRDGARLIGTNTDATYPTPRGPIPGAGSILASIRTASGVEPELAGKPHLPIARIVQAAIGPSGMVVGDRIDTDGAFATTLGYRFGLVLSGVTLPGRPIEGPPPDLIAEDLATLVHAALSGEGESH
ncbi:MAG: HAD-IIA family hydrolase [Acidobacteria bacterium]|nr:HAD-IIA family hydrolase [Acidobacteriota bacterium]